MVTIDLNLIFVIAIACFAAGVILGVRLARPRSRWE